MKGTAQFTKIISDYLDMRESTDALFASQRRTVNRSIDDIVTYILNEVKASGCNGFDDSEIFGMAVHAACEENINIGERVGHGAVIVNHHVELTEEEKEEQRKLALRRYQENEYRKIQERNQRKPAFKAQSQNQPSLFDF